MSRALRSLAMLGLWAAIGLGCGLLAAIAAPLAFDARPLTVLSGSMEPALNTGDVVVAKRIAPSDARIGDVITYRDPQGRLVTHRVRGMHRVRSRAPRSGAVPELQTLNALGGRDRFVFVTKGDANNAPERWTMAADGELSRAVYRVPLAGRVLSETSSREGKLLLVVLPLLFLAAWEVKRIWRPRAAAA